MSCWPTPNWSCRVCQRSPGICSSARWHLGEWTWRSHVTPSCNSSAILLTSTSSTLPWILQLGKIYSLSLEWRSDYDYYTRIVCWLRILVRDRAWTSTSPLKVCSYKPKSQPLSSIGKVGPTSVSNYMLLLKRYWFRRSNW